jgi:hypothetical protein
LRLAARRSTIHATPPVLIPISSIAETFPLPILLIPKAKQNRRQLLLAAVVESNFG